MKKKVMAVVLSLAMAATTVPWEAVAAETAGPGDEVVVVEEEATATPATVENEAEVESLDTAEEAVIVDDTVEIAGIEELEIPEAEESVVTEKDATPIEAEVVENPELELGDADTPEGVANVGDPEKNKSDVPVEKVLENLVIKVDPGHSDSNSTSFDGVDISDKLNNGTLKPGQSLDNPLDITKESRLQVAYSPTRSVNRPGVQLRIDDSLVIDEVNGKPATGQFLPQLKENTNYTCEAVNATNIPVTATKNAERSYVKITFSGEYRNMPALYILYTISPMAIGDANSKAFDYIKVKHGGNNSVTSDGAWVSYNGKANSLDPVTVTYDDDTIKKELTKLDSKKDENGHDVKPEIKAPGSYYWVEVSTNDGSALKDVGSKQLVIHGEGNYTGTVTINYTVNQVTAQDGVNISYKKDWIVYKKADANGKIVEGYDQHITNQIKDEVKDILVAAEGGETIAPEFLTVKYYQEDRETGEDKLAGNDTDPKTLGTYKFYIIIDNARGDKPNFLPSNDETVLKGTLAIRNITDVDTMREIFDAAVEDIPKEYVYANGTLNSKIENDIISAFKTAASSVNIAGDVTISYKGDKITGNKSNPIVNVGAYEITIEANSSGGWRGEYSAEVPIKVVQKSLAEKGATNLDASFETVNPDGGAVMQPAKAVQTLHANGTWTDPRVYLKWKNTTASLVKDKDYTITWTQNPGAKIAEVSITGIGNYTSTAVMKVECIEKIDLSTVTAEVTGINLNYQVGDIKKPKAENILVKENGTTVSTSYYRIRSGSGWCHNGNHVNAGQHYVTIESDNDAKCFGSKTVYFNILGRKFDKAYTAVDTSKLISPVVDKKFNVKDLPHNILEVVDTDGGHTSLKIGDHYTARYYYAGSVKKPEDGSGFVVLNGSNQVLNSNGKTDFSAKDTLDGVVYSTSSKSGTVTFEKAGQWYLVITPNYDKEKQIASDENNAAVYKMLESMDGVLAVPFEVSRKPFTKWTSENRQGNVSVDVTGSIEWIGGEKYKTIPEELLKDKVILTDISVNPERRMTEGVDYTVTKVENADKVGKAVLTFQGKGNYDDQTFTVEVEITKRSLKGAQKVEMLKEATDYQGGKPVLQSDDLTISFAGFYQYDENWIQVDPSEYEVKVVEAETTSYEPGATVTIEATAKEDGNYSDSVKLKYEVRKGDIGNTRIFELQGAKTSTWLGEKVTQDENLILKNIRTGEELKIKKGSISYTDNDGAGKIATVTVKAEDETRYTGEAKATFEIVTSAVANSIDFTFEEGPYTYTGTAFQPAVTKVTDKTGKEIAKADYQVSYRDNVNAGKAIVAVTVNGTTIEKSFTINKAQFADKDVTGLKTEYTYDGTVQRPVVTVTVNGKKLEQNKDFRVYNTESVAIGPKELAVVGIGNYEGNVLKKFNVVPAKAVVKKAVAGSKKLTVTVKKQSGAETYKVQYRVKGKSSWKTVKAAGGKKVIKNLKAGKKYQVRVRAIATINGAEVKGAWSAVKVSGKVK